ncbi:isochorismatase [Paractinoplanes abujensis]|uniref:Nicotinamidase-related amidase n=1 Tax=Paractinoplanes abujensis TaxID=882441 RepID=A0A7W7G0B8_9ACTN|nr:isochorismatase family protein [Actinoplanes abujensis]MBB4691462.1 nicotinamidase-related amidase [Actinoplanes abujensis]GID17123.1 isochorismatase [Actinoplanes abujensis]
MTTLKDRPGTALLVVDVQTGVVAAGHDRDAVLANIATLADRAHAEDVPVIWVQQTDDNLVHGSESWQLEPSLPVAPGDTVLEKQWGDCFEATELEALLAARGVGRLVVTGAQTDACIRSTLHGAFTRGYDTLLVSDAHTTEDLTSYGAPPPAQVIAHTNLYWSYQSAPGRTAGTALTKEVTFTA